MVADCDGVITQFNAVAERLLGHRAQDAIGSSLDLLVPEAHRAAHWVGFRRGMESPEIKDLAADMPVLCADGEERRFAGRLLILSDGLGMAIGAMGIYTDRDAVGFCPFD